MAVETQETLATSPEERLRSRALDTIKTHALEVILAADEPQRTVDLARTVADRLSLSLSESELGGFASLVRLLLDSDPLYSQANRQWDLALRMGRAEGDRKKPVERSIEDFVDLIGRPAPPVTVATLVSAVYGRDREYYEKLIEKLADTRPQFFRVGDRLGISRWLLEISSDDPEDVEFDNFSSTEELDAVRKLADGVDAATPAEFAQKVVSRAEGEPVNSRALLFTTWCRFPGEDPRDLFVQIHSGDGLIIERGPSWVTGKGFQQVLNTIRELASEPESVSELVVSTAPAEDDDTSILAPTTVRVSDDDLDQVHDFVRASDGAHRVADLCQQALEAFPGSRTYQAVHDSLLQRMKEDSRFVWVGFERFRLTGSIPQEVQVLPDGMAFDDAEYLGEDGVEVDKIVEPREWKLNLDQQILHYQVQDVGDDASQPGSTPSALVSSPPLHHYVAGTRYLRNCDRGFFPVEPDLLQVTLVPENGEPFDVWVNNRLGMIYGLKEWYDAHLPWVGGQFTLERTTSEEYRLLHNEDTDELMDIPLERLQELLQLRGEAAEEGLPLTEIVSRILRAHPEGIHFVNLFAQVNVVRRTRRANLAGILSSQRFFSQSNAQPGIWSYDEKRAAKPKKKTGPKRPIRDAYDDEDDFVD